MFYLYILQNRNRELYFGATKNLKRRIFEHTNNRKSFAGQHGPWKLVYYEAYASERDARNREHQIKYHGQAKRRLRDRLKNSLEQS